MPWGKNMTAGERTIMVADRIGGGTFCKKICKTAKGGSLPMTALALGSAPPSRWYETKNFMISAAHRIVLDFSGAGY
jgi:hypothetical protein